jgi:hypothetical protein
MCLREICDQAVSMGAECAKGNASFSNACGHLIIYQGDRPIGFGLKLLNRDLSTGVGLQKSVKEPFETRVIQSVQRLSENQFVAHL